MSSQQKRGFRLPWAVERSTEEGAAAATLEAEAAESTSSGRIEDGVGDDIGEGPFHFAEGATPDASTDASPEAPDVPETTAEAEMTESETATTERPEAAPPSAEHDGWPEADQAAPATEAQETTAEPAGEATSPPATEGSPLPPIHVEGESRTVRANPLVAGLIKAMREAAQASREETTTQLSAEATARVEAIREAATGKAADLRKQADEDIAGIREWSKTEIARLRQETEERIERRKSDLAEQTQQHEARVERNVDQVRSTVSAFESDMDQFFQRLLAENDPAKLAALAEQAPEPPDLSAEAFAGLDSEAGPAPAGGAWNDVAWTPPSLEADAAAEAEAAATEGLDLSTKGEWPASVLAAARRTDAPAGEFEPAGVANSRLSVNGLTSVAGISAFKGALSQLSGVKSVSVSSGEPGVFIFTVVHSPETDLQGAVAGLTAFSARVTDASGESLTVVAHEPAA